MTNADFYIPRVNPYMGSKKEKVLKGKGGLQQAYDFLYEDENDDAPKQNVPIGPTTEDLPEEETTSQSPDNEDDQLAMAIAFSDFSDTNPYIESNYNVRTKGVNPYLQQTAKEIFSNYDVSNLGVWGDKSHQQRQSDHNTGDAQDFGVSNPNMGNEIVSKLQSEASERNVKYIIYNGRIWNPSVSREWRKYDGPDPHKTHIHVSYNR